MGKRGALMPPVHPGGILREDFMKPLDLSVNKLALELHVPATRIGEIVHERRRVTAEQRLGAVDVVALGVVPKSGAAGIVNVRGTRSRRGPRCFRHGVLRERRRRLVGDVAAPGIDGHVLRDG